MSLAIEFAGADHRLGGSDYPHQIGSLQMMRESIAAVAISEAHKPESSAETRHAF